MPQCLVLGLMNAMPALPGVDDAFMLRMRVIEFPFVFVEHVEFPQFQRRINAGLKETFKSDVRYRQQFLLMLLERVRKHEISNPGSPRFPTPPQVLAASRQVVQEADPLRGFLQCASSNHVLEVTRMAEDKVMAGDFLRWFNRWGEQHEGDKWVTLGWRNLNKRLKALNIGENVVATWSNHKQVIKGMKWTDGKFDAKFQSMFSCSDSDMDDL